MPDPDARSPHCAGQLRLPDRWSGQGRSLSGRLARTRRHGTPPSGSRAGVRFSKLRRNVRIWLPLCHAKAVLPWGVTGPGTPPASSTAADRRRAGRRRFDLPCCSPGPDRRRKRRSMERARRSCVSGRSVSSQSGRTNSSRDKRSAPCCARPSGTPLSAWCMTGS